MSRAALRDVLVIVGLTGIGLSVWWKDYQLVPGVLGGVLLVAALVSFAVGRK